MKRITFLMVCAGLALSNVSQAAGRPLGPPKAAKHGAAAPASGKQLLREAQLRVAPYLHAAPAPVTAPPAPAAASAATPGQIYIPNLPGNNPGPAPATLGRPYTQDELTRSWAPYTYP